MRTTLWAITSEDGLLAPRRDRDRDVRLPQSAPLHLAERKRASALGGTRRSTVYRDRGIVLG
jgi:hypothetical protein